MLFEMSGRWLVASVFGLSLALGGCGGGGGSDDSGAETETKNLENEGTVCLKNPGGESEQRVEPGDVEVRVWYRACLRSSCDRLVDKGCSLERSDGELTVESEATIESKTNPDACTTDCALVSATCGTVSLEEGEYSLTHGEASMQFSLPADEKVCGAGESPGAPQ